MTQRTLLRLYKDNELSAYITAQARRFFSCVEDREDVSTEVWEKFATLRRALCADDVRPFALRVIKAAYMRKWRRRRRERMICWEKGSVR